MTESVLSLDKRVVNGSERLAVTIEVMWAVLVMFAWTMLFAAGIIVDSSPWRQMISAGKLPVTALFRPWFNVITTYTPTNILLLACCASMLGATGRRFRAGMQLGHLAAVPVYPYFAALIRGFFLYLAVISGMLLINVAPFTKPGPDEYLRLAGLLSLAGFMMGYNPMLFSQALTRLAGAIDGKFAANGEKA